MTDIITRVILLTMIINKRLRRLETRYLVSNIKELAGAVLVLGTIYLIWALLSII